MNYSIMRKHSAPASQQRGIALFVVVIFVLLSMLLALWSARSSMFNELVVGNDVDYQRAFEAAQALLLDAEMDTREEPAGGAACGGAICRAGETFKIPLEAQEVGQLLAGLNAQTGKCSKGLCVKRSGKQDFWEDEAALAALTAANVGARYGQVTGAKTGTGSAPANPILADTSAANRGGWYWVEVLPYVSSEASGGTSLIVDAVAAGSSASPGLLPLSLSPNVVYRMTALAYGRKPGTMVVLQQTYAQQRLRD